MSASALMRHQTERTVFPFRWLPVCGEGNIHVTVRGGPSMIARAADENQTVRGPTPRLPALTGGENSTVSGP